MNDERPKHPRPPGRPIIERPRLLKLLENSDARTMLLIAPAGYGKTTLLRQWSERNEASFWFTAETGSSDVAQLAVGLGAANDHLAPGLHEDMRQIVSALTNPPRQTRELVEAFASRVTGARVGRAVIDDYHLLATNAASDQFVFELAERLGIDLLVGSRLRPAWATARAELYGEVFELGPEELALTDEESEDVLADAPAAFRKPFLLQANGWPAVIGLAALTKTTRRAPDDAVSSTLFRFFAEELFATAPETLQEDLLAMALLPTLSGQLMEDQFGDRADTVVAELMARGFVTVREHGHDLHPLIREFMLSKVAAEKDAAQRISAAFTLALETQAWDATFALITRFDQIDSVERFLQAAFMPLARSGRIGMLEEVRAFARGRAADFTPTVVLIDAELALRDGLLERAESIATSVAEWLGPEHPLASHAYWIAGQAAQLGANFAAASEHFARATATSTTEDDARDALWGSMVTSTFSEGSGSSEIADALHQRRYASPTDLMLATTAAIFRRRYRHGFAEPLETDSALENLAAVPNPRIRTVFAFIASYERLLRADYDDAEYAARLTKAEAEKYQLKWPIPQAEWVLAAAALGRRDFAEADRWLKRVESTGAQMRNNHIKLNAAALRARYLLALQRPDRALDVVSNPSWEGVNPAMKGEFYATRALVRAVNGDLTTARLEVEQALALTSAVEVSVLGACVAAVCHRTPLSIAHALATAQRLNVWDPFVATARASPVFLTDVAAVPRLRPRLQALLQRTNDFDLARRAGLAVGRRRRSHRTVLSPREREVLELVRQGLTNRQIGETLFISHGTAKVHVRNILDKLDARTRAEAAARDPLEPDA